MKQKVSDYIADHIAEWGIRDVFTVTGGGAMHMNDAFGHHPKLHCTYQHHEQACAMAAEAYARMDNRMAAVCVTTVLVQRMPLPACLAAGWIRFLCLFFRDRQDMQLRLQHPG